MTTQRCAFCGVELAPADAHLMSFRGKGLFVACEKHADTVTEGVKSSALFLRGAMISGAKHYADKRAPGVWDIAVRALSAYRDLKDPAAE